MTRAIVQSDVELAKRLIEAGCENSGIVAWLQWRGVDAGEAAALVANLRENRMVKPLFPCAPEGMDAIRRRQSARARRRGLSGRLCKIHPRKPILRQVKRAARWACVTLSSGIVVFCFAYVGLSFWANVKAQQQRIYTIDPNWRARGYRAQQGYPETAADYGEPPRAASSSTPATGELPSSGAQLLEALKPGLPVGPN